MADNPFDKLNPQNWANLPDDIHPKLREAITQLYNGLINHRKAFAAIRQQLDTTNTTVTNTNTVVQQFQNSGGGDFSGPSGSTPGDIVTFADASGKRGADPGVSINDLATKVGVQEESYIYAADTGAANAYVIALTPVVTAYVAGQEAVFIAAHTNTGASTLDAGGGAKNILKMSSGTLVALAAGDITVNQLVTVKYDGTQWQMPTGGGGFTAGGDLAGTSTSQEVIGILSKAIDGSSPSDGNFLQYQSGSGKWELVWVYQKFQGASVGSPVANQPLMLANISQPMAFAANFLGSEGSIDPLNGANPVATVTLTVKKVSGGVSSTIGTISISTSGVFTFATTGGTQQNANTGDMIAVYNQSPADASLSYPSFVLVGFLGSTAPTSIPNTPVFTWKGAYSGATTYAVYDVVSYQGGVYVAIAGGSGNVPTNTSFWNVMMGYGWNNRGAYSGATAYVPNDVVTSSGSTYLCIAATTGNAPPNGTYWQVIAQAGANGSMTGPGSSTNNDIATFNGTSGTTLQDSGVSISTTLANNNTTVPTGAAVTAALAGAGGLTLIQTQNPSGSTGITFALSSSYDEFELRFRVLPVSAGNPPVLRFSTDGGVTYDSTAGNYVAGWQYDQVNSGGSGGAQGVNGTTGGLQMNFGAGNNSSNGIYSIIRISNPAALSVNKFISFDHTLFDGANWYSVKGSGVWKNTTRATNVQLLFGTSGGTFTGKASLYGLIY